MNSLIAKMTGQVTEAGDAVPVPATVLPGSKVERFRGTRRKLRRNHAVAAAMGMLGEADENEQQSEEGDNVFPEQKEDGEPTCATTAYNRPVNVPKEEPADPYAHADEERLPPVVALVAPDVTPQALVPLEASQAPGAPAESTFTTAQANNAPAPAPAAPSALDTVLGRDHPPAPGAQAGPASPTAESAASMMGVPTGRALFEDGNGLGGALPPAGSGMPEHRDGDPKKIMQTFRRFARFHG